MRKIFVGVLAISLLTGCGSNLKKEDNVNIIFKEEMTTISEIGEKTGKKLSEEILVDDIKEIFNNIFELAIFESNDIKFGEVIQGAGSDGNGGRVFCCKLPVDVKFVGTKASIEKFVEYFEELETVVSFSDFRVEILNDEMYEVNTVVNFLGKAATGVLSDNKIDYAIKKNEVDVEEETDIDFRKFDVSMIIRPSNSDSSAVSLGVAEGDDYRIYDEGNSKKDIEVKFINEGNKYFCEYKIEDSSYTKAKIKPNGNILFDIWSCDVVEADDEIKTDLHIINNSNKKVSVMIHDDNDGRVKVVEKVGSIEVKN